MEKRDYNSSTVHRHCFRDNACIEITRIRKLLEKLRCIYTYRQLLRHNILCKGRACDIIRDRMYVPKWKTRAAPIIHFCTELSPTTEIKLSEEYTNHSRQLYAN